MTAVQIAETVNRIIVEQLGVDAHDVTPTASFLQDLDCDSLDVLELMMSIEEEFGLEISDNTIETLPTVNHLYVYLAAHAK